MVPIEGGNINGSIGPINISKRQRQIYCIHKEFAAIAKRPIEGIYVTPGAESPQTWFGLLIVRSGVFYGGIFRFTISLPIDFPDSQQIPTVIFEDNIFHPMIHHKTNQLNLNRYFPSGWQSNRNHVYQVLIAVQGIFFSCHCDLGQAANPEAAILLKENRQKFVQLAHDTVRRSRTQVYAEPNHSDRNAIRFLPWNEEEMEPFRLFLIDKCDLPFPPPQQTLHSLPSTSNNTQKMEESLCSGSFSVASGGGSVNTSSVPWLWYKHLSAKPKGGFSWIDADSCKYMCDISPSNDERREHSIDRSMDVLQQTGDDDDPSKKLTELSDTGKKTASEKCNKRTSLEADAMSEKEYGRSSSDYEIG